MTVSIDTNLLVRGAVRDDPRQTAVAEKVFQEATAIAISLPVLCEFVWVVQTHYKYPVGRIILSLEALIDAEKVILNRQAVEAGILCMKAGADFADGVIAYEGIRMGSSTFFSFDQKAVAALRRLGYAAEIPH